MLKGSANPLDYDKAVPPARCAWVVFLLSTPSYLPGVLVLDYTLKKYRSDYPLIVAVNSDLPSECVDLLTKAKLNVRTVKSIVPKGKVTLIAERFADTWTKCAVFDFVEYDRLVLIDGDMMIRQNMDELFKLPLGEDQIAATFACVCNLDKSAWAPDDWKKENCGFTRLYGHSAITHPGDASSAGTTSLLNSGLVVLSPSRIVSQRIEDVLKEQEMVSKWMFPDQDLLAEVFRSNWVSIPWVYNALKTMRYWHGNFYRDEDVKNLHYIVDKPWKRRPRVGPGEFLHVKDGVLGLPADQADAVTHGWWWDEYDEMSKGLPPSCIAYLLDLVDA